MDILQEHYNEHLKLGLYAFGAEILTVGIGGNHPTIAEALAYIGTQSPYSDVDIEALTCDIPLASNTATFSGTVTDIIRPGDLLYLDADANPTYELLGTYDEHWYPILDVGGQQVTDYDILLACALVGANAKVGYTPKVFRPNKYVILLTPGDHFIANPAIPNGFDITIAGFGNASTLYGTKGGPSSGALCQRYGYTTLRNIKGIYSSIIKGGADTIAFPYIDEGLCFLSMSNVQISSEGSPFNGMNCAGLIATDVVVHSAYDHSYIPIADYTVVDGWTSRINEHTEAIVLGATAARDSASHRKILKNISATRFSSNPYRNGQDFVVNISGGGGASDCIWDISNLNIIDHIGHAVNPATCLYIGSRVAGGTNIVNINGGSMEATHANHTAHIETGGAVYKLRLRNIKDQQGKQLTVKAGSGTLIEWLDPDAAQDIAYATPIAPNVLQGHKIIVGELTGNIVVNAATGDPTKGERLVFSFSQDVGGTNTITWHAVYNVHANPVGGGSEKAVFEFEFDGTNWVQVNTTAWA